MSQRWSNSAFTTVSVRTVAGLNKKGVVWKAKSLRCNQMWKMWQLFYCSRPPVDYWIPVEPSDGIPKGAHVCSGITGPRFDFYFPVVLLSWLPFSLFITQHLISYCVITTGIAITISVVVSWMCGPAKRTELTWWRLITPFSTFSSPKPSSHEVFFVCWPERAAELLLTESFLR